MEQLIGARGCGAPVRSVQLSGVYDPSVESAGGFTIDTQLGPVDLVAIERARSGRPTPLTPADYAYLIANHPTDVESLEITAEALGIRGDSIRRAIGHVRASWGRAS
jgi:hypothetical protein